MRLELVSAHPSCMRGSAQRRPKYCVGNAFHTRAASCSIAPSACGLGRPYQPDRRFAVKRVVPASQGSTRGIIRKMSVTRAKSSKQSSRVAKAGLKTGPGNRMEGSAPKLIAFDLDATLWYPEIDMLSGPPFRREEGGRLVVDRSGEQCRLMGASHDILHELVMTDHFKGSKVAYISRCDIPKWANQCLSLFEAAPGVTLRQAAHYWEIYPGRKTNHFRKVHKESGIAYRDMLFFDNEYRNIRDCSAIGITCMYTPDGMTRQVWEKGLQKHAKAVAARSPGRHDSLASHNGRGASSSSDDEDKNTWGGHWS